MERNFVYQCVTVGGLFRRKRGNRFVFLSYLNHRCGVVFCATVKCRRYHPARHGVGGNRPALRPAVTQRVLVCLRHFGRTFKRAWLLLARAKYCLIFPLFHNVFGNTTHIDYVGICLFCTSNFNDVFARYFGNV